MAEDVKSFLGIGWSFPPSFSRVRGGVKLIADEEDIHNSIMVLLATKVGERLMQPKYGCNLDEMLFEPLSVTLQTYIKELVFTAIFYFEPRVNPEGLALEAQLEEGVVLVKLEYTVRATNTRHNLVYPYYIGEGTNLMR